LARHSIKARVGRSSVPLGENGFLFYAVVRDLSTVIVLRLGNGIRRPLRLTLRHCGGLPTAVDRPGRFFEDRPVERFTAELERLRADYHDELTAVRREAAAERAAAPPGGHCTDHRRPVPRRQPSTSSTATGPGAASSPGRATPAEQGRGSWSCS
jgi:hypothetical protein